MRNTLLFLCFRYFLQINDLTRLGVGIYEIQESYGSCKVLNTHVFCLSICNFWNLEWLPRILISSCFKILLLGLSKVRNTSILPPGWCIYSFQPFIGFFLKTCSEVDTHFVLFEFAVVLLWETMTFYLIIWGPHNGDPVGIALLKLFE